MTKYVLELPILLPLPPQRWDYPGISCNTLPGTITRLRTLTKYRCSFSLFCFFFLNKSHDEAQGRFELATFLFQPLKQWDCRCVTPSTALRSSAWSLPNISSLKKILQMCLDKENQGRAWRCTSLIPALGSRGHHAAWSMRLVPSQGHIVRPYLQHETSPALSPHYFFLCQTLSWYH